MGRRPIQNRWIVDQYSVKAASDPNREDDPSYIVRLLGQVVRVSVETARIVNSRFDISVHLRSSAGQDLIRPQMNADGR